MLRSHPEIRRAWPESILVLTKQGRKLQHIWKMNFFGRYLLQNPLPSLSIWSLVLEKANREPSVLYEFLKGPAFAGRDGEFLNG